MTRTNWTTPAIILTITALSGAIGRAGAPESNDDSLRAARVARGNYLVGAMGCNDCHTPMKMGPNGPERDMSRMLTGHPEDLVMPSAPVLPKGPWMATMSATMTAWSGPWGVSFTANLTPDKETGLGLWTEEMFIATMKTGRHQGKGRPVLPPMPVEMLRALNDEDIKSVFAYLQSLPPVRNRVPAPIDPPVAE